jgi:N-hydroxyarylamine O-acetyltransferase
VIDEAQVSKYLTRLGVEREVPSVDALRRLHRAHLERVPYETLWMHMGEAWGINPADSVTRIVEQGRGGYCFHVNGAFHELLQALGYRITRHVGTVHGPGDPPADDRANHVALIVSDLPDGHGNDRWYLDAGLGDAIHDLLPLQEGKYTDGPLRLGLRRVAEGQWQLLHDPTIGAFTAMTFSEAPAEMSEFQSQHHFLSTSPQSFFARTVTAQRRDATGIDILRGLVLKRIGVNSAVTTVEFEADWYTMLADVYGLHLSFVDPEAKRALWVKSFATHTQWLASQTQPLQRAADS